MMYELWTLTKELLRTLAYLVYIYIYLVYFTKYVIAAVFVCA